MAADRSSNPPSDIGTAGILLPQLYYLQVRLTTWKECKVFSEYFSMSFNYISVSFSPLLPADFLLQSVLQQQKLRWRGEHLAHKIAGQRCNHSLQHFRVSGSNLMSPKVLAISFLTNARCGNNCRCAERAL